MRAKIDIAIAASSPWAVLADYPKVALPVAGVNLCQSMKPHTPDPPPRRGEGLPLMGAESRRNDACRPLARIAANCGHCFLKPVALDGAPGGSLPFVALPTDPAAVAKRKRIAIWLMVGGFVAGGIIGQLTSSRWAILGLAVSLAGFGMFSLADPRDRPPPKA